MSKEIFRVFDATERSNKNHIKSEMQLLTRSPLGCFGFSMIHDRPEIRTLSGIQADFKKSNKPKSHSEHTKSISGCFQLSIYCDRPDKL